jgi:thymidylate synthase
VHAYLELLDAVLSTGEPREDRTGVGTRSLFGWQLRVDLAEGFPLLTTKRVHTSSVVTELLWFLSGRTDNQWLNERGCTIWDEWATPEQTARFGRATGDLGPIYGHQWRNFGATPSDDGSYMDDGVDQIRRLIDGLVDNPESRRHLVTGWNPLEADRVALPPCHTMFQFYAHTDGRLSCQLYQRSADVFLGVPFNIASYALLVHLIARLTGRTPGHFVHTFGDVHLYNNHVDQARKQLSRTPRPLPRLSISDEATSLENLRAEHFVIEGYDPYPGIKAPVAV